MWVMDVLHSALKDLFVVGTSPRVMLMSFILSVVCFLINNDTRCLWVMIWLALGLVTMAFKTPLYNTCHGRGDGCGMDGIEIHLTRLLSVLSSTLAVSQYSSGSMGMT